MDKRDYELLLALDQHKNITKAAQSLYMTQPAITKRIQKMEEELHCPLLIRSKRGVLLTPAAESLLPCARTILKSMEQMEELAAASQDYICGTLRLGCSLNYAHYRLPGNPQGLHRPLSQSRGAYHDRAEPPALQDALQRRNLPRHPARRI